MSYYRSKKKGVPAWVAVLAVALCAVMIGGIVFAVRHKYEGKQMEFVSTEGCVYSFAKTSEDRSKTSNGIVFTQEKNGAVSVKGTATADQKDVGVVLVEQNENLLLPAGTYYLSGIPSDVKGVRLIVRTLEVVNGVVKVPSNASWNDQYNAYSEGVTIVLENPAYVKVLMQIDATKAGDKIDFVFTPSLRAVVNEENVITFDAGQKSQDGLKVVYNEDGTVTISGTATKAGALEIAHVSFKMNNKDYLYVSGGEDGGELYGERFVYAVNPVEEGDNETVTLKSGEARRIATDVGLFEKNTVEGVLYFDYAAGTVFTDYTLYPCVNVGSPLTSYVK